MRSTRPLIPASVAAALIISGLTGAAIAKGGDMRPGKCGPGPEKVEMMFERLDANGDGKISAEEMAAAPQRRFEAMDANGDGKVSAEEMVEHRMTMMRARIEAQVAGMIAEMDDDGDGMLSAEEMGPGRRAERRAESHRAKMFAHMDADDDGVVTLEEAQAGAAKMAEHHGGGYGRGMKHHGEGHGMKHHGEGEHGGKHHGMGRHHGRGADDCPAMDDE